MEENLILEGLLSMVTELKEKQKAQVVPASREETIERLDAIERVLSELQNNPAVPEKELQAVQNQLADIRKAEQEQQQSIGEVRKYVTATYHCLKEMLDALDSYRVKHATKKREPVPTSLSRQIYGRLSSWVRPKAFLFLAGLVICFVSLFLNVRLVVRMQRLEDNDMKYRYILMKGKADGSSLDLLEMKFSWERDNAFIRNLTDSVKGFEQRSRKQAEALERARLLNEQAEQLKKEADKLGKP